MLERVINKYALSELVDSEDYSFAVADKNQKIIWFNKGFKKIFIHKKIKGLTLANLFNLPPSTNLSCKKQKKIVVSPLPGGKKLKLACLKNKGKLEGYFVQVEQQKIKEPIHKNKNVFINKNSLFSDKLRHILDLMIKENSLPSLSQEILTRCTEITQSNYGIIVFNNEDNRKYDYIFYDPEEELKNKNEIKREIQSNFSFISKWLDINRHSLQAFYMPENIGYNITRVLQCYSAVISPCFWGENILAAIIVCKKEDAYDSIEIKNIEQYAPFLAFTINNIRTRDLNTILESRLLQSQKLETIGKLSSGMAHDFNNLLSSIFGSLNLLKKRVPEKEEIFRLLDNIENCSIRAKDLTKGLLSFGKPAPKRKELIKPNLLLSEISKVITETFPQRIIFNSKIEGGLSDILGNATEIYQVLLNLCVNAKEAIDGKGEIYLEAKNVEINETNRINYPFLNIGNYIRFLVKDSGSGIKEENLTKIFDPYFSTKDKKTGSGSGLGLYVTYGIIKAHRGHVEVSSVINKGTTFDVFLPAYKPAEIDWISPSDKIILLADDEQMLLDLLAELLESSGYSVVKVSSGAEALKILTEEIKVDLAIIDYNMPEMNGIECIEQIRKLKLKIPIILSSGSISFGENFNYKNIGINALLSKPYEFDSMLATIKKLI